MEYINLKQYINKQTGDILEAIDWNNLHTTLQNKINEVIGACNDISSVVTNSGITLGEITINGNKISASGHGESLIEYVSSVEKDKIEVTASGRSIGGTIKTSITPAQIQIINPDNSDPFVQLSTNGLSLVDTNSSAIYTLIRPGETTIGNLSITPSGISKETEGGTLKIDSKHNALWLHGGGDSSVLDGHDVTIGAGNKITLDANNGVEITSSRIDLLSDNIGVKGDEGRTCDVTVSTPNGTCMFSFKNGILIGYNPTIEERPVDLEDIDKNP